MSNALPLPPRPNLEQYKKRGKDLVKLLKAGDRDALRAWLTEWLETLVELHQLDLSLPREDNADERRIEIERTVGRLLKHFDAIMPPSCTLAQAQFTIAREHGFASWAKF